jgi:hypothetical protein
VRWRVLSAGLFVSHLLAVFAVYSAHLFHHFRKRLNMAHACASFFLLARSLSCSERARLLCVSGCLLPPPLLPAFPADSYDA